MMVETHSLPRDADSGTEPLVAENPRAVRLSLAADEEIADHSHPDTDILFYVVAGDLELRLDGETYDLGTDEMARFDGERTIAGTAREPTTALVVLARRPT